MKKTRKQDCKTKFENSQKTEGDVEMLRKKGIIALILTGVLFGCSSFKHGPVPLAEQPQQLEAKNFSVQNGKGNIYVVYTGGYNSSYRNFPVSINGVQYGFLSDGTFMRISVAPGSYTISSSSPENQQLIEIDVQEGNNYFFEMKSEIAWRDLQVKLTNMDVNLGKSAVNSSSMIKMPKFTH